MITFAAPIGGTPYPLDFAPSILFAVLYAAVIPLMMYRVLNGRSRTVLLTGAVIFTIERTYVYTLRAVQSRNEKARLQNGFVTYMQFSYSMGYLQIASDMVGIVRCLLVNATYGSDMYPRSPAAKTEGSACTPPPPGTRDQPELRGSLRTLTSLLALGFWSSYVIGVVGQIYYAAGFSNQADANQGQILRLVSSIGGISSGLSLMSLVGWSSRRFPQYSGRATVVSGSVSALMTIVGIYRVSVMQVKTTSLTEHFSLNDSGAKAAFYIFHSLPEWLAVVILFGDNIRQTFGTGPLGDYTKSKKKAQQKKNVEQGSDFGLTNDIPLREKANLPPLVQNV